MRIAPVVVQASVLGSAAWVRPHPTSDDDEHCSNNTDQYANETRKSNKSGSVLLVIPPPKFKTGRSNNLNRPF